MPTKAKVARNVESKRRLRYGWPRRDASDVAGARPRDGARARRGSTRAKTPKRKLAAASPAEQNAAALNPRGLNAAPRAGPKTNPMPIAAPSMPMCLARSSGGVASAMYACAAAILPPNRPAKARASSNRRSVSASPVNVKETADPTRLSRITGRRPTASETRPSSGAPTNWAAE
jgi:hypothetical protein